MGSWHRKTDLSKIMGDWFGLQYYSEQYTEGDSPCSYVPCSQVVSYLPRCPSHAPRWLPWVSQYSLQFLSEAHVRRFHKLWCELKDNAERKEMYKEFILFLMVHFHLMDHEKQWPQISFSLSARTFFLIWCSWEICGITILDYLLPGITSSWLVRPWSYQI